MIQGAKVGTDDDLPRVNSEEDLDLIRPQLLALVKSLLPSDRGVVTAVVRTDAVAITQSAASDGGSYNAASEL